VTDVYRDPLAGLQAKRATAEALEGGVPSLLWSICAPERRAEIARLHERGFSDDSAEANDSIDVLISRLEDFVAHARAELVCGAEVDEPAEWAEPVVLDEGVLAPFRDGLLRALSAYAGPVSLERLDNRTLGARFQSTGVPLVLRAKLAAPSAHNDPWIRPDYQCNVRTSVPACLPELELTTERVWHSVEKAVGLAHEVQLGDPAFDDAFWVRGDPDLAKALLAPRVREELLVLSWRTPRLSVKSGLVDVEWQGRWEPTRQGELLDAVRAAIGAALTIRTLIDRARKP